ncbi:ABC transporter substrate-binding protein [Silicimonas algicola]|uniref:Carbohydrate ABC transporter substrate-binding protein (CUT1 family) n=1 Tax=Silicimonas algicola TaxID=1826607 RepID=A0A316G2S6_9RHOB|nr:extracellular solute-binding protein [Silicimonas algicola]PWK54685.1 carbohydrate ABC transporter substrate-binding protein (CUT1 family) [Silicimonas algicola]
MTTTYSRRQFGGILGAALSATALSGTAAFAQAGAVRLIWWGNPERDKRTNAVVDLYQTKTGSTVSPETYAWGDYWQKLATQAAGKSLPDVIQMDYRYIFEYARRNQLAALDEFIGSELELADYDANQLASGVVDGKTYGISMGANSMSHVYNKTVLDGLGVTLPDSTSWTTDDWVAIGKDIKDKLPDGMYFSENMGILEPRLQTWVRSAGKDLYTPEGKIGYDLEDLVAYFEFWKMMQDEGLTPPADVQAQDSGKMEESMMATKQGVFNFLHSNQLVAMQNLVEDEIDMVMIPNSGPNAGQYMKPSMFLSMSETAADKAAAAQLMNFFITDPDANDILLIERGVTGDASIRERITPGLTETEQKIINYLDIVGTHVSPLPPPPPANAGEIDRALRPAWESVAFGQVDLEAAAKDFYENSIRSLERA